MKFIYLFDPLCGWCYAASRGIQALAQTHQVDVFATGLFANTGRILDESFAHHAWTNDTRIAQITGLPFTETYRQNILLKNGEFNSFNLTMTCFLLNENAPSDEWLPTFAQLQKARYVDGLDTSRLDVVQMCLRDLGETDLAKKLENAELSDKTNAWIKQGQVLANQFGVRGVPSLIAETERGFVNVPSQFLYQDIENVAENISTFLA
ncbi:DsbA family protein [Wielerella bovis]|uniref:DsbA family protein n=1 Tax=Wielerella bovis TaxID=2917790 RepID=UPI0020190939|nr:DsbA family protein [Wielerella bovis]MCG7657553.1 DsbA family protein [Wielerella bovis]MCG7659774.1 DsbA family protein [Wielerella bovis]